MGESFIATGSVVIEKGWKVVTTNVAEEGEEEEQTLPALKEGQTFCVNPFS